MKIKRSAQDRDIEVRSCSPFRLPLHSVHQVDLGVSDMDLFDLYQKQRHSLLTWLDRDKTECSEVFREIHFSFTLDSSAFHILHLFFLGVSKLEQVMEAVERIVTMTGSRVRNETTGFKNRLNSPLLGVWGQTFRLS